jgi:hypothetical protein
MKKLTWKEADLTYLKRIRHYRYLIRKDRKTCFARKGHSRRLSALTKMRADIKILISEQYSRKLHGKINRSLSHLCGRGTRLVLSNYENIQ